MRILCRDVSAAGDISGESNLFFHGELFERVLPFAQSKAEYLKDCISLFEEYGWDWCYHAFREWDGWSVEHSDDPRNSSPVPHTLRKQVLLDAFKKNRL